MRVHPKPSPRFVEYVRKIACDEWESLGPRGTDQGLLRHRATGAVVSYLTHDGGNDLNGPRNFANDVQRICGCRLIEPRGRKRSRKTFNGPDAEVEAQRRRHLADLERKRAEDMRRQAVIRNAAESYRRELDIRRLMGG